MALTLYPLSSTQTGIYFEWVKDKSLLQYNASFLCEFPEQIVAEKLREAYIRVVEAHPILKSRIRIEGETVFQYFQEHDPVEIPLKKVSESVLKTRISEFIRPFDLAREPLFRIEILQVGEKLYALSDFHHIIFDGTSLTLFNQDLAKAYAGENIDKETFTLADFALLESSQVGNAEYLEAETFFAKRLKEVTMTRLPSLSNKEPEPGYQQRTSEFVTTDEVNSFCRRLGISPNNLFAGALGIVLSRYTREKQVAFCTVHNGRLDERLLRDVGMFVKTLPVVIKMQKDQHVSDYLADIRADLSGLWKKTAFPFTDMVDKFHTSKEIMYAFQKGFYEYFTMEGSEVRSSYLHTGLTSDSLNIYVFEEHDEYEIRCEYNDNLYDQEYMQTLALAIKNTVLNIMANENADCGDISILSPEQEAKVIAISSGEQLEHDRSLTLTDLFREQVGKSPDRTAVVFEKRKLTYRELDEASERIAKVLHASGVQRGQVVGVMIDRSEYMAVYPLAVMKAGAAYMPLDYSMPADRLSFMVKDAGAKHILSEGTRVKDILPDFDGEVINYDQLDFNSLTGEGHLPSPAPEDFYVLLYTSGSTGTPKGCMLEHRNMVNFCRWYVKDFDVTPEDRAVAYANFAFDAHMIDIFPMLSVGASVYILPSAMRMDLVGMNRYMEENQLTIGFMTTQIGRQFAEDMNNHSLRLLSVGGERLIPTRKPPYRFYNVYGPTECTLFSTFYSIDHDYDSSVIGHSMANVQNFIMDGDLQLLPVGVPGELCIGGEGVGRGYLGREDLNAVKFMPWRGKKLYRSGDLARYNKAGEIEYLSRLDNQVKLRGLRIELGEIENVMSGFDGISAAVTDVKEIGGVQHLCGYFTAKDPVDLEMLRNHLRQSLSEFMVPTAFIQMEKFPLTNNGKVNRKILPVPQMQLEAIVAPQTEAQQNLFVIISELLKTDDFGIDTNLFSLGLTSILAIKLSVTIQNRLGISVMTKDILKLKTIRRLAEIEAIQTVNSPTVGAVDQTKRAFYPLTENQKGLYYDWEKNREALQYNIAASLRFSSGVNVKRLKEAVLAVVEAHPYLKTTLAIQDEEVVQLRRDELPVEILTSRTTEARMESVLNSFVRPFNLFGDTLYRFDIHQTESFTYLLFDIHHIIFDGTSLTVLVNDLRAAFEGKSLVPETFTAFDKALEEEVLSKGSGYAEAEAYFDRLIGTVSMTAFPSLSSIQSAGTSKEVKVFIPSGKIVEFCRHHGITESNYFLTVYCMLLSRYTREEKVVLTTASSGRADNKLSELMGMFIKTLPVVADLKNRTVLELAKAIQDQSFDTMENDLYPFTKMVEKYGVAPQINFVYQGGIDTELYLGDECAKVNFLNLNTVKFPVSAMIFPDQGGYTLNLEFDEALYQESDMRRFTETFSALSQVVAGKAGTPVAEISLLTGEQESEILRISSGAMLPINQTQTLTNLFHEQVQKTPDRVAVVYEDRRLTYRELDELTGRIARKLHSVGIQREKVVGVMIDRSELMVVYPLAILKAGGAYMPLDFSMPADRLAFMVKDAGVEHILSEGTRVKDFLPEFAGFVLNSEEIPSLETTDNIDLPKISPEDMFILLYTSGSTGTPKGCMLEHRNLVNFCHWYMREIDITPDDRSVAYANFAFDAHMIDIYPQLFSGASVYILPSRMRMDLLRMNEYMEENQLTLAFMTTQVGRQFAEDINNKSLRLLTIGGERLIATKKPRYRFFNLYGPTECTICSTFCDITRDYDSSVIGKSVANVRNFIMDKNRQLLPLGVAGELCIGGEAVGRGYLNRDDLTREKFVEWKGQKLYRTGDLARYNEAGEIEYLSRLDNQVKLRGLRIELGEIEHVMSGFEGISSAVVDVKEIGGVQQLCGYFIAKTRIDTEVLYRHLKTSLTSFMIPAVLMQMEKFPLTNNGKVNRKALPVPELTRTSDFMAASNEMEENICRIYSTILKTEKVGILDNFFEIGGNSITAIKAVIQIMNLGYKITYGDLFKLKSPQAVAGFLSQLGAGGENGDEDLVEYLSDYDYTAIDKVLENSKRDLWNNYHESELGDILLTGATGYLGIHVFRELIRTETGKIYCLVRSKGTVSSENRLKSQLAFYFSDSFDELFGTRLFAINGDMTDTHLMESLMGKGINTVINCAASVKHFAVGDELNRINIDGVAHLIDFCKKEGARLIHISTRSSSGIIERDQLTPGMVLDESKLYFGQKINNKYVSSKFKSERLVLQAVSEGLDAKVMRVGNLMGRQSDGEFQINFRSNAFVNTLKSYKVMKMFPLSQLVSPLEISPIDCVAGAVVSLSRAPREIALLHPYNNYHLNMATVIFGMQEYGFPISLVSDQEFNNQFQKLMKDPRKSEYLSGLLHYQVGDHFVEIPENNDYTTTLLFKNGFRWPMANDDYPVKLIGLLDGMGFFDEN